MNATATADNDTQTDDQHTDQLSDLLDQLVVEAPRAEQENNGDAPQEPCDDHQDNDEDTSDDEKSPRTNSRKKSKKSSKKKSSKKKSSRPKNDENESPSNENDEQDKNVEEQNGDDYDPEEDDKACEVVSVDTMLELLQGRSFGALLFVPALMAWIPLIGSIPGMSVTMGIVVIMICVQMLLGGGKLWLPKRIRDLKMPSKRLAQGVQAVNPWVRWVEKFLYTRLPYLNQGPFYFINGVLCLFLGLLFIPAGLFPWVVFVPSSAVLLFSIGMTPKDGVVIIAAWMATGVACWFGLWMWPQVAWIL